MLWEQAEQIVQSHLVFALTVLALLGLVSFAAVLVLIGMNISLKKRYRRLMMGRDGVDMEKLLNHYAELSAGWLEQQERGDLRMAAVEKKLQHSLAGVGLVRYNAFQDTGSDLSFSLALLDHNLDGVMITSIYSRDESRCYGKPIGRGKSPLFLSDEEQRSLSAAQKNLRVEKKKHQKRSRLS